MGARVFGLEPRGPKIPFLGKKDMCKFAESANLHMSLHMSLNLLTQPNKKLIVPSGGWL
jgi:hypothetical protein